MKTTHKLMQTKCYDMFDEHPFNRELHKDKVLEDSMRKHGFMPSSPIQCVKNGGGKLKVLRGHHRLDVARRLGIAVYYVVDETNTDIFQLEGSSRSSWNVHDFAHARAKGGDPNCSLLLEFKERHGITIGAAASLLGGQSAGSANKNDAIKRGAFRAEINDHARDVMDVVGILRQRGVSFATTTAFVAAVSAVLRAKCVSKKQLMHRAERHAHVLSKQGTRAEYLAEIESLYNWGVRLEARVPVALEAAKAMQERSPSRAR